LPALIVSYSSQAGGAERILADHATAIDPQALVACPEGWLADRLEEQGLNVILLPERSMRMRGNRLAALRRLRAHAREIEALVETWRPRVVVAWGMRTALACAAASPAPRFVFQHNDLLPDPVVGRVVRAAAAKAERVIALSDAVATDLDPGGKLEVEVIRPGVDLERFHPAGRPSGHALFLGAITPWKRPELAVEAAARAGVPLTIAGAPLDPEGERLAARLRAGAPASVIFAGRVPDPAAALRDAAVLLHCADREPYGMALVESLASGVPVVAPAAGGPREIVDDSCARLYRPGDAEAAAAALTAALADRDSLGRAARARAERLFDLEDSRRRYAELFARPPVPSVAVVTVLHNSEPEIRALMQSIDRHLPGAHLVAVDSDSSDGGARAVRNWPGRATVIELGENAGYGRGTNAGIAAVEEDVTLVLNPDVELLDESVAELAHEAAAHPERILAPLVLLPDGSRQDSVHPPPAAASEVVRAALPRLGGARLDPWRADTPRKVGWAVGCALAASTATLRTLGPFDERTFMYAEDLDLGLRAGEHGVETWFWPHARVLHKQAHATTRTFDGEPFDLLAERRRAVVEERLGRTRRRRDDLVQAATFANRIAFKTLLRKPAEREKRQLRALLRARRGPSAR
jgi:GT2 family glycosyltransferase/glycosyltransferase involved in cell wall biosynthesis